jgi:hypothetical protein
MLKTVIIVSTLSGALAAESCADGITAGKKCTADYISKGTGDCAAAACVADDFKAAYGSKCCKQADRCSSNTEAYKGKTKITVPCRYQKGDYKSDYILCPVGKYTYRDSSFNAVCSDTEKLTECDSKATGKEKLTAACSYSKSYSSPDIACAKDMYYWGQTRSCEDRVYPCTIAATPGILTGQSYCGPKSTDDAAAKAEWKPEFKGACTDYDTCDPADLSEMLKLAFAAMGSGGGNSTVIKGMCPITIRMTSTPGKCQADCAGGASSASLQKQFKNAGCTASEESSLKYNADKAADAQGIPRASDATTTMTSLVAASAMVAAMVALF